jgi:hypothetical protein
VPITIELPDLKSHLKAKLAKSEEARKLQQALVKNGTAMAPEAIRVASLLRLVQKIAEGQGDNVFAQLLIAWKTDLEGLKAKLITVDGLIGLKDRLTAGWRGTPNAFQKSLKTLTEKIAAKPPNLSNWLYRYRLFCLGLRLPPGKATLCKNSKISIW